MIKEVLLASCTILLYSTAHAFGETAYMFNFKSIDGKPLPLSEFRGNAVLIVNTASRCGFTSQYQGLQALWENYREKGLVVLGVPSNDFGGQEPGTEEEIKEFCQINFNIDFPLTEKVSLKGRNAHPFFTWAAEQLGPLSKPRWNFYKILLNKDGKAVDWFASSTAPSAKKLVSAIEQVLFEKN